GLPPALVDNFGWPCGFWIFKAIRNCDFLRKTRGASRALTALTLLGGYSPSYNRPHFLGGNMLSKRIAIFLMLVAALLATSTTLAQSTTTVQGTVTDSKGAVLPNATVVVRNK